MDNFIIVVNGKVVWKGRDSEAAWKARDAIVAAQEAHDRSPNAAVYQLADESGRDRW